MTRKPRIVPPRKPRGESRAVTIAMQDKQIALLVDRCEMLQKERDAAQVSMEAWYHKASQFTDIQRSYERLLGWQDCAREILQSKSTGA